MMGRRKIELQNGIGHYLCKRVLFFSFFVVALLTLVQAGLDFRNRMAAIPKTIDGINVRQVEESLWDFDKQSLRIQAEGIIHFPYMNYAAIVDQGKVIAQAGEKKNDGVITRKIPLLRMYNGRELALGSLYLQADTRKVFHKVLGDIALIFMFQSAMVAMVAFFIFGFFEFTVTRHLSAAAAYFRSFDAGMNSPLNLEKIRRGDELDTLADAFNGMRQNLDSAYRKQLNAEKKFRDLLETVRLAAVMLDNNGNITFCNDYFLGLTGRSREEALGGNWFNMFLPDETRERVRSVFKSVLASGESSHYENPIITRDGRRHYIEWDNSVLKDHEGKVMGTASIGIDITEHRKLEEQLRQAQKMEAIGQLAGGVAHDFNNILSAIVGYAHLTLMKMNEADPLKGNLEQILGASERATTLTQSLLSFSRKQVMSPKPVDLNDIVKGLEKLLLRLIREDIEIKIKCHHDCLTIFADKGQIEQMLVNLITNARDAMPGGGHIVIETGTLRMGDGFIEAHGFGKEGKYAYVYVSDTGHGMDDKTRRRIFEPFFTTKEQGKGTGLGLSMVYGVVKQHDGHIDVYSEPGRGTTFKIYLPLFEAFVAEHEHGRSANVHMERGSGTVLVAEDDPPIRQLNATVLRDHGYAVIEAVDGEDAVRKFSENSGGIQLIIMDCIMPRKNGKEAYDEIRKKDPSVKAIFLSGYAEDIISKEGLLEEGINFVLKPVTPSDLLRKVKEALS